MSAMTKILTGTAGLAALVGMAAPAAAQYYPQPSYGYPTQNGVLGSIINNVLGYGRYPQANYGYNQYANSSMAIDQCARAVEARLGGYNNGYAGYGYGYGNQGYNPYGYNNAYAGSRVQGVTRVERKNYGLKVWGVASSGNNAYNGYGQRGYGNYGYNAGADLKWDCEVTYNGQIRDIDVSRRTATWRGY